MNKLVLALVDSPQEAQRIIDQLEHMGAVMTDFLVIKDPARHKSGFKRLTTAIRKSGGKGNPSKKEEVLLGVDSSNLDGNTIRSVINELGGRHVTELTSV